MATRIRPGNPLVAIAYLRVSTDGQKLGPEAQRAAIEAWAAREGVSIVAWHLDQGVSGAAELDARPGLVAALAELRAHRAGVLVVAKRDRLARDVYIAATIERAARRDGARVICADGAGNGDSPTDAFMRTIVDGAAEYERAIIRGRVKAALAVKKARGERIGAVPFGYAARDDGKLVPNPLEQAVIARVRELRAEGCALRAIVAECARGGLVSRAGRPLALTQIARIVAATGSMLAANINPFHVRPTVGRTGAAEAA